MAFSERVVVLSGAVLLPTTVLAATEVTTEEGLLTARETGGEIQLAAGQTARQRQSRGKGNRAAKAIARPVSRPNLLLLKFIPYFV